MGSTIQLEAAAIAAFARGDRWHAFVQEHRTAIQRAERRSPGLVGRLLALVTSGTTSGMAPVDVGDAWGEQGTLFDMSEPHRG